MFDNHTHIGLAPKVFFLAPIAFTPALSKASTLASRSQYFHHAVQDWI